jgi:uncharacterized protein (DUF427 family)
MNEEDLDQVRAHWSHRGSRRPDWAIKPGPGEESVWDYPRPPRLEDDSRVVRVVCGNTGITSHRNLETSMEVG